MSPISAISGYLELINISLFSNPDTEQIEHYSKKIQNGIKEVNFILEQLQDLYSVEEDDFEDVDDASINVDINWVVREVCSLMQNHTPRVSFLSTIKPVYVFTNLFMIKLIVFNLINNAVKSSPVDEIIMVNIDRSEIMASVSVTFNVGENDKKQLRKILNLAETEHDHGDVRLNSFNKGLLTSSKLAQQIDGEIKFDENMKDGVKLYLLLPLANNVN